MIAAFLRWSLYLALGAIATWAMIEALLWELHRYALP